MRQRASRRARQPLSVLGRAMACLLVAGCAAGPVPDVYVLGDAPAAASAIRPQSGLPVVDIKPVRIPDYLDTTDLVVRTDGRVIVSRSGRWGERLSTGITRALVAALGARLPHMVVTSMPQTERPAWQLLLDVAAFEARSDGRVVLVADWTVVDSMGCTAASARVSLTEPVGHRGDAAIVAAMTRGVDALASDIAGAIDRASAKTRGARTGRCRT